MKETVQEWRARAMNAERVNRQLKDKLKIEHGWNVLKNFVIFLLSLAFVGALIR